LGGSLGRNRRGRHLDIQPRIAQGLAAARAGARALMDISDGLCIDLHRMARLSGTRIELELARVPIHPDALRMGGDALNHALHDGEDHELLIGVPARLQDRLERAVPGLVHIGRARRGRGLVLLAAGGKQVVYRLRQGGWLHGA
jgi:thiamine-monophosphate kinase